MKTFDKLLWRLIDRVILVAVISMVCLIAIQVSSRLAGASVPWTEELTRFLFIWTIWLGLAAGFRNGQHPALSVFDTMLPKAYLPILRAIPAIAAAVLFAVVTWHGWILMMQQIRFGEQSAILQVGMWLTTLPLVLGAGLAILGTVTFTFVPGKTDDRFTDVVLDDPDGRARQ